MDPVTQAFYDEGFYAGRFYRNPYSSASQIWQYHAWEAGHWDKWGRV